jgi:hypothetical protein
MASFSVDKPSEFAPDHAAFVSVFCIFARRLPFHAFLNRKVRRVHTLERPALLSRFAPYDRPPLPELNSLKIKHVAKARDVFADFIGPYDQSQVGGLLSKMRAVPIGPKYPGRATL